MARLRAYLDPKDDLTTQVGDHLWCAQGCRLEYNPTCLSQAASLLMLLTISRYGCNSSQKLKVVFYSMAKTI